MKLAMTLLLWSFLLAASVCCAQPDFASHAKPVGPAPADAAIVRALATIEPSRIEKTIETLVRFGTRSSLSSMEEGLPAGTGIEAAAGWILDQSGSPAVALRWLRSMRAAIAKLKTSLK